MSCRVSSLEEVDGVSGNGRGLHEKLEDEMVEALETVAAARFAAPGNTMNRTSFKMSKWLHFCCEIPSL